MISYDFLSDSVREVLNSEFSTKAKLVTALPSRTKYIRVIFHSQYSAEDVYDMSRESYLYWARCHSDDVVNVKQNDKITINGTEYNIESIELQQDKWTILRLTK